MAYIDAERKILPKYLSIIEDFLEENLSAGEVMRIYRQAFQDEDGIGDSQGRVYEILQEFFCDCEDFVEDPSLRRPSDYDEAQLRRFAERARGEILALMKDGEGNGSTR